jgi:spore coat protein U-like protein
MKRVVKSLLWFSLAASALGAQPVFAAITCTLIPAGFTTTYGPTNPTVNSTQSSISVTCIRNLAGDPASITYTLRVNNGGVTSGGFNLANSGANTIRYDTYQDSGCTTKWGNTGGTQFSGTLNFGGVGSKAGATHSYWGCVPALLNPAVGTYTDILTPTFTPSSGATLTTPTFNVSITTPGTCVLSTVPGNVVFTYTAFGTAQNANTTFGVNCSNLLPYTMALDASNGVVSGLLYTLSLSATSSRGTGVAQTHTISGTMAAGQAGGCSAGPCPSSNAHTVTITY